jgi:chlorophyll(ide) b reductase
MCRIKVPVSSKNVKNIRSAKKQLKVCITGGSKGLGKSITQQFLQNGDKVFIVSRNATEITDHPNLYGYAADVGKTEQISPIFDRVHEVFDGEIDIFLNCAAISGGFKPFEEQTPEKLTEVVQTNLLGTTLCSFYAYNIMKEQPSGGAIFNLLGNGSNGSATPQYAIYGGTKSAIQQLTKSLQKEWKTSNVDLHLISPGLMATDLLMDNLDEQTFDIVKDMCTAPDIVAHHIVPRMRYAYYSASDDFTIKFQTVGKIIYKLVASRFN